jgi:probable HAF family extracellular repeat protein
MRTGGGWLLAAVLLGVPGGRAGADFIPLGDLPGGAFSSQARGVSADGSVVVGNSISASGLEAFRWTAAGGMIGLGDLPGSFGSGASSVSADGAVVVALHPWCA